MSQGIPVRVSQGAVPASGWRPVAIAEVVVAEGSQEVDVTHVTALRHSFEMLGGQLLLQPIVVDEQLALIDGRHRLEAARQAGWSHIAALVVRGATHGMRAVLEVEAHRLRRSLSVLELEAVWRAHYEPELRAAAKSRQLAGLRKRGSGTVGEDPCRCESVVLGNTNNQVCGEREDQRERHPEPALAPILAPEPALAPDPAFIHEPTLTLDPAFSLSPERDPHRQDRAGAVAARLCEKHRRHESIGRAAKRITGYSLDTLNKVTQIRELADSEVAPAELRQAAVQGLQRLARSGSSVESVYRALREFSEMVGETGPRAGMSSEPAARRGELRGGGLAQVTHLDAVRDQRALERVLAESSLLAERLEGGLSDQLRAAAERGGVAEREMLRAARVSLAHCLAAVAAIECDLEPQPILALRRVGGEVNRLLGHTPAQHTRAQESAA